MLVYTLENPTLGYKIQGILYFPSGHPMEEQGGQEVSPPNNLGQLITGTIDSRSLPGSLIWLQTMGIKAVKVEVVYCMM